jgi:DNA-binding transcriptional ArsR family regulator
VPPSIRVKPVGPQGKGPRVDACTSICWYFVVADLDVALRALADRNRRNILTMVRERPVAVGDIAARTALSQQAVSHHVRVLRNAGLLTERHEGTRHLFLVRTDGFAVVADFLDDFRPRRLAVLTQVAGAAVRREK